MDQDQLQDLLIRAIAAKREYLRSTANPMPGDVDTIAMRQRVTGQIQAFEDVLEALRGNLRYLNLATGEY